MEAAARTFVSESLKAMTLYLQNAEMAKVDPFIIAKTIEPMFESVISVTRAMEKV